ncbi:hypothetical protein yinte0001_1050 [Yersinia intermedia ATCC 29909]|nr:hypothetical protein yinte0001_1050 [Yersinia intermedia ATCC 29909]
MAALPETDLVGSYCASSPRWFLLITFFAISTAGLPWAQHEERS